jgi:hypothetical protein
MGDVVSPEYRHADAVKLSGEEDDDLQSTARHHLAPKKRFKMEALRDMRAEETKEEEGAKSPLNPFRPWSEPAAENQLPRHQPHPLVPHLSCLPFLLQNGVAISTELAAALPLGMSLRSQLELLQQHLQPVVPVQDEPLALVKEKPVLVKREEEVVENKVSPLTVLSNTSSPVKMTTFHVDQLLNSSGQLSGRARRAPSCGSNSSGSDSKSATSSPECDKSRHQRNYKNLTRERRVEANARERQRVHTITAAFDTLQAAIPSEDENVKLSKLSVIKIATAYIMALSRMAGYDYTEDQSAPSLETVVQHCQEVIHTETRIKKRNS